jgi:cytochrome c-type biogenesis protein
MLLGSLLFVLGFSVVFVAIGALSGAVGAWLVTWRDPITLVLGSLTILLGLAFAGFVPVLQREWRVHAVPAVGLAAAPLLGFLFGLGWTPCIGPTLGVILTLTANETGARGGLLLAFYSLGLGIPFVLAGLAWQRALRTVAWVRRHQRWVTGFGGALLVLIGVALLTGLWAEAVAWVQIQLVSDFEVSV